MKVYKYRDFSNPTDQDYQRFATMLHTRAFWCARPDTLNDPEEFGWVCDYRATGNTIDLIARLLVACCDRSLREAREYETLWQRYGGSGAGVSVEIDVPDHVRGKTLFDVQYLDAKQIHVDQLALAFLDPSRVFEVYSLALLSKPTRRWHKEEEIRFVSKRQGVSVIIDGSKVTRLFLGDSLSAAVTDRLNSIAGTIEVIPRRPKVVA